MVLGLSELHPVDPNVSLFMCIYKESVIHMFVGVFGTPLCKSIRYAKVSVGYVDETSVKHPEAGTIPIVVAQCGSFLKAKGIQ